MKIFLMKINVNTCKPESSLHIFFSVTRKISTNQTPPGKFPPGKFPSQKTPTWNIPTHVFKYSHPSFLFFLLLLLLPPLSLILLKRLFCNSMFQKCWSLYVCELLSKRSVKWRKTINEMGGNIPGENFLGGSFLGRIFQG